MTAEEAGRSGSPGREDWTRALFEAIDDAVFVHDLEGRILEANPAACSRLGYTRAELLALNTRDIDDPTFASGFQNRLQVQLQQKHFRCEGRHRTKDGRLIPVDINTSIVMLRDKMAVLAVMRDITESKEAEERLAAQTELYHSLLDYLPQNIFRKDQNGRVTYANKRYLETLHFKLEDLLGKTDHDLFPPHLADKYVADDRRVIEQGMVFDTVEEHRTPEGKRLFVQVVKIPLYDAAGNPAGIQGIFWDVTEKKETEERVAESERRYRQLTEATLDGIVVVDQDGTIELFNPSAQRMFGYRADELLGRNVTSIIPAPFQELHSKGLRRYVETGRGRFLGRALEVLARRKDGSEFPVEIALSAVGLGPAGADGKQSLQFLGAIRDLSERNKMRSVLVQNEKLASIGLLSAGVAHEINNPLAFVANNLVVLERDVRGLMSILDLYAAAKNTIAAADAAAARNIQEHEDELDLAYTRDNLQRLIGRTREGVDRVTRIVQSLRGLARTDTPKHHEVSLADLVETSLEILRTRYKRSGIEIRQEHDPNPRVECVSTQMSQVVLNLLVNAFQAVEAHRKEGGRITIRTRRDPEQLMLEIEDNGGGIAPEHLSRLFDPFFTTKDVGEGTGLGLSITHNIVTAHGGTIDVDSRPGAGACFRVFLPLEPPRQQG